MTANISGMIKFTYHGYKLVWNTGSDFENQGISARYDEREATRKLYQITAPLLYQVFVSNITNDIDNNNGSHMLFNAIYLTGNFFLKLFATQCILTNRYIKQCKNKESS